LGKACSIHGRNRKCIQILSVDLIGRDHFEDLDVTGRRILRWILKK
jgi:hypothetical protein